jgi:hypothetical protein
LRQSGSLANVRGRPISHTHQNKKQKNKNRRARVRTKKKKKKQKTVVQAINVNIKRVKGNMGWGRWDDGLLGGGGGGALFSGDRFGASKTWWRTTPRPFELRFLWARPPHRI